MAKQNRKQQASIIGIRHFEPITKNQHIAASIIDDGKDLLILGYAGTGKSYLALAKALEKLRDNEIACVRIIRSTVPVRDQGFLPGDVNEKQAIYERPYTDIVNDLCGRGDAYQILKSKGAIKFDSTSYVRGLTFDNCVVVLDEVQNATFEEINSVYTRLGDNSSCIMCGDFMQTDEAVGKSGLGKALRVIEAMPNFEIVEMSENDIVRSDRVKEWIIAVEKQKTVRKAA